MIYLVKAFLWGTIITASQNLYLQVTSSQRLAELAPVFLFEPSPIPKNLFLPILILELPLLHLRRGHKNQFRTGLEPVLQPHIIQHDLIKPIGRLHHWAEAHCISQSSSIRRQLRVILYARVVGSQNIPRPRSTSKKLHELLICLIWCRIHYIGYITNVAWASLTML